MQNIAIKMLFASVASAASTVLEQAVLSMSSHPSELFLNTVDPSHIQDHTQELASISNIDINSVAPC